MTAGADRGSGGPRLAALRFGADRQDGSPVRGAAWAAGLVAVLTPLSVDGVIVTTSTTPLTDSWSGRSGGCFRGRC